MQFIYYSLTEGRGRRVVSKILFRFIRIMIWAINKTFFFLYPKVIPEFIVSILTGKPEIIVIEPPSEYSLAYFAFSLFFPLFFSMSVD